MRYANLILIALIAITLTNCAGIALANRSDARSFCPGLTDSDPDERYNTMSKCSDNRAIQAALLKESNSNVMLKGLKLVDDPNFFKKFRNHLALVRLTDTKAQHRKKGMIREQIRQVESELLAKNRKMKASKIPDENVTFKNGEATIKTPQPKKKAIVHPEIEISEEQKVEEAIALLKKRGYATSALEQEIRQAITKSQPEDTGLSESKVVYDKKKLIQTKEALDSMVDNGLDSVREGYKKKGKKGPPKPNHSAIKYFFYEKGDRIGALIKNVHLATSGYHAGLRTGDLIVKFNGTKVNARHKMPTLMGLIRKASVKQARLKLLILRDGKMLTLKINS